MHPSLSRAASRLTTLALAATAAIAPVAIAPAAHADASATGIVINEAYLSGGSTNAAYTHKFVELYNPTDAPVSLDGWSIQYRSATGTSATNSSVNLTGTIQPGDTFLVSGGSNGSNGATLPTPDQVTSLNPSGTQGTLILATTTERLTLPTGSITGVENVADLLGYGASNTFETKAATAPTSNSDAKSLNRTAGADSDNNSADFTLSAEITPTASGGGTGEEPEVPTEPETPAQNVTIAEIQGDGERTPLYGKDVVTRGIVTAAFPTGGLNGLFIQTPGTGGDMTATASHGVFVYAPQATSSVAVGDYVEVAGVATEYYDLTQVNASSGSVTVLAEEAEPVRPLTGAWPATDAEREAFESMLWQPESGFTVADNYSLNQYGELTLSYGTSELVPGEARLLQPTDVAPAGSELAAQIAAENATRSILLDDGSTADYMRNDAAKDSPLPYLDAQTPIRVGAAVEFTSPVVLHYSFDEWRFQPQGQVTGADDADVPVAFEDTREYAPAEVGGDVKLSSFNVLNYFPTTGEEFVNQLGGTCSYYTDRDGEPVGTNRCNPEGPRGAADAEDFERQEAKIVAAINGLDADVVSLEEIENSAKFGKDRDFALATLTDALNEALGAEVWAYVPSPAATPASEDVIRTAFIYKKATVKPIDESVILDSPAFSNARQPLAQAFQSANGGDASRFLAVVNHFKSKGSDPADGSANADSGDGQGAWNAARVEQAEALVAFADSLKAERNTDKVFLTGDFNSYTQEDPMQVLYEAGYVNLAAGTGEYTYLFDSLVGSLDHILASPEAVDTVTGHTVWDINADESIALEYSRHNYNVTDFYTADPFRASDHDPAIVGLQFGADQPAADAWDANSVYNTGDVVSYEGATFEAQWYSKNQVPGASPYSAWAEQGKAITCPAAGVDATAWTASEVYNGGEKVVFDGKAYEAKWYSRNQAPGQKHGPWNPIGSC